jgi:hypothetical protein
VAILVGYAVDEAGVAADLRLEVAHPRVEDVVPAAVVTATLMDMFHQPRRLLLQPGIRRRRLTGAMHGAPRIRLPRWRPRRTISVPGAPIPLPWQS